MIFLLDFFGSLWFLYVSFWFFKKHATPPFRIPFPRPWPSFSSAPTSFPSSFHLPILAIRNFLPEESPSRGHGQYFAQSLPQRRPPAAAGPRRRGRFALQGAATSSLDAPAGVADAEGPVSRMVVVFPSKTTPKWWTNLCLSGHRGSTGKPALTSPSYQQTRNLSCPSHIYPCTGPVFGSKLGQTLSHDSEWTSKIHLWYQIKTGSVHKKNWQAIKPRSKGCEEGGLKQCPFSIKSVKNQRVLFPNSKLYTLNLVYWSRFWHGHYYSPIILKDFHHL